MDYATRVDELEAEGLTTSDAQGVADAEEMKLWQAVRSRIRLTSAYPELRDAAIRFHVSLHGKASRANVEQRYLLEPEDLLSAHAGVMNAKSARCQTLRSLADQVIKQAELPMCKAGLYRGQDYRVRVWDVPKQWAQG